MSKLLKIAREIGKSSYEDRNALKKIGELHKIMGDNSKAEEYPRQIKKDKTDNESDESE